MSASAHLHWASEVPNGLFPYAPTTHSGAAIYSLSATEALIERDDSNGITYWERLDIRTGHRSIERRFGHTLAIRHRGRRDGSFDLVAPSPDGRHLLGYREYDRFERSHFSVISTGGDEQRWPWENCGPGDMTWLRDGTGWFSQWKSIMEGENCLWRFHLGERHPRRCRLRGLQKTSPQDSSLLNVLGTTRSGDAIFTYGQINNTYRVETIVADIFVVAIEDGATARRLRPFRVPVPRMPEIEAPGDIGYFEYPLLSPRGDNLLLSCEHGSDAHGRTTGLYACDLDGGNLRLVGHGAITNQSSFADTPELGDFTWNPDNRHFGVLYGTPDQNRLYVTRV